MKNIGVVMETHQDSPQPQKPRLNCADRNQANTLPIQIDNLIENDHPARIIWAFVDGLDLSPLYQQVRALEGAVGRSATDAKILMAIWLFSIINHETRARRIAELCTTHLAYIWLCGGVGINHHTLSDFWYQNEEYLQQQFTLHLTVLIKEGFVKIDRVAQDGIRIRANAGAASFRRKETLEDCLEEAKKAMEAVNKQREENPSSVSKRQQAAQTRAARERCERVEEALKQIPDVEAKKKTEDDKKKARVSTTDPDARVMKMANGGYNPAFNGEFSTDTATQIIIGVDVVNEGSDQRQFMPMLEQIKERTDEYPNEGLIDGGFASKDEIDKATEKHIVVYAPVQKPKDKSRVTLINL
jgi:transposase